MANILSAYALIELDEAKQAINAGAAFSEDDDLILYINGVTDLIEGICGRHIRSRVHTEIFDGDGGYRHRMREAPIIVAASTDAVVYNAAGSLVPLAKIKRNLEQGEIYLDGYNFEEGFQNCSITYTAGLTTVPAGVKTAAMITIARMWKMRDKAIESVGSITVEGQTITFKPEAIPLEAMAFLSGYRRPRFA